MKLQKATPVHPVAVLALLVASLGCGAVQAQDAGVAAAKPPAWITTAAFGLTLTSGNSDTLSATANILAQKKWSQNELGLGADATYGENDGNKTAESLHGFVQYNRLFTERMFGYLRADAMRDAVADVDYRITLSPGVGYYFIKNETTSLSGEVGPGLVLERQGGNNHTYMTLRVAERFEHKLNARARIWQSLEWLP